MTSLLASPLRRERNEARLGEDAAGVEALGLIGGEAEEFQGDIGVMFTPKRRVAEDFSWDARHANSRTSDAAAFGDRMRVGQVDVARLDVLILDDVLN